jgi:ATP-dependent RNA helicase DDX31/DBP7
MGLLSSLISIVGTVTNAASSTCSLLFIGACRIDEGVTEEVVQAHLLQEIETGDDISTSRITLAGFSLESLNEMMSEVLCMPRRKTSSLSQAIHEKTQGMPLFVVEVRCICHQVTSSFFVNSFLSVLSVCRYPAGRRAIDRK